MGNRRVTQLITTLGAGTWTCPPNVASVTVEVQGGGGGTSAPGNNNGSGGGGGGGYSRAIVAVTPGVTYDYLVGNGGQGANNGQDSFWVNTSTILAKGGVLGSQTAAGAGGLAADGVVTVGGIKYSGGNGAAQLAGTRGGGGGGGASDQGDGGNATAATGGTGAQTLGGNGGNASTGAGSGQNGNIYGGGGGCSYRAGGGQPALNGAQGYIQLTYDFINITEFIITNR